MCTIYSDDFNLTTEQRELLNKHILAIFAFVNSKYRKESQNIREDLYSIAYVEIAKRMNNYDSTKSSFIGFINNILTTTLNNYYYREILGYCTTTKDETKMTEEQKGQKEEYEIEHNNQIEEWKIECEQWKSQKEMWEKTHDEKYPFKRPNKPNKKYVIAKCRKILTELDDNVIAHDNWSYDVQKRAEQIREIARKKLNPIEKEFFHRVFEADSPYRITEQNINNELYDSMLKIKDKIEMYDSLNIKRSDMILPIPESQIEEYFFDCIKRSSRDEDVFSIFKKIKMCDGFFSKNKIVEKIKRGLEQEK